MYKRIDEDDVSVNGFIYKNNIGGMEGVVCNGCMDGVDIGDFRDDDSIGCDFTVILEDIPKMIKALQTAYDYMKGARA